MAKDTTTGSASANTLSSRDKAIEKIRSLMATHNLTLGEIRPPIERTRQIRLKTEQVELKEIYRDPVTKQKWDGQGRAPSWLVEYERSGKTREEFIIRVSQVKPKVIYRDPTSGEQWDGTGRVPKWLADYERNDQPRDKFMIKTGWGRVDTPRRKAAAKKTAKKTTRKA